MESHKAIMERRTIRRYTQEKIEDIQLRALIDAARCASCASNNQRLRYIVVRTQPLVNDILAKTKWAARVQPKRNPVPGISGPTAFIAVTVPAEANDVHIYADAGAAIQSMEIEAWSLGIGCCWIGSVDIPAVEKLLNIDESRSLIYVVALGKPDEKPVTEDVTSPEDVKYYLDEQDTLHVPKLAVDSVSKWM